MAPNKRPLPSEIAAGRLSIEGAFVMSLWKKPDLFKEYKIDPDNDFVCEQSRIFYKLGASLVENGASDFDEVSVEDFISRDEKLKDKFDSFGGIGSLLRDSRVINTDNIQMYYNNLVKENMLIRINESFHSFEDRSKFINSSPEDVYAYYEEQLDKIADVSRLSYSKESGPLTITEDDIKYWASGQACGLSYGNLFKNLNNSSLGLSPGLFMLAGHSGVFKTSMSVAIVESVVMNEDNNAKACIISNEQTIREIKAILSVMVINKLNKDVDIKDRVVVTRRDLKSGNMSKDQINMLYKAKEYTEENYNERLLFETVFDYNIETVERIIRKNVALGYNLFLYDTFKADDLNQDRFWQAITENSKRLFQVAHKYNIPILLTYQLNLSSSRDRYLDATNLSSSKSVKEVLDHLIMMRVVAQDEYDSKSHDLHPYIWKKDAFGNYEKVNVILDPDKKYLIVFTDKSRSGPTHESCQIIEVNPETNDFKEYATCEEPSR